MVNYDPKTLKDFQNLLKAEAEAQTGMNKASFVGNICDLDRNPIKKKFESNRDKNYVNIRGTVKTILKKEKKNRDTTEQQILDFLKEDNEKVY